MLSSNHSFLQEDLNQSNRQEIRTRGIEKLEEEKREERKKERRKKRGEKEKREESRERGRGREKY